MTRARPRTATQVRGLILEAARTAFAEQGYARTTTRQVAKAAGVAPSQLFAHFGTKASLFEHAAIAPYADLLSGFVARWESLPHKDIPNRELCRDIVADLFELFTPRAGLVAALVLAQAHEDDLHGELGPCLEAVDRALEPLERFTVRETAERGLLADGAAERVRLTHGTVLAVILLGLFDEHPVDRLADLMADGFTPTGRTPVPRPVPVAAEADPPSSAVRARLVEAAREAFLRHGFTGAGTRAIAVTAETSETVLFRHFAGKEALFDEAVCRYWTEQVAGLVLTGDLETQISELCGFFATNRELVLTLLEAERLPGRSRDTLRRPLLVVLDGLRGRAGRQADFVTLTFAMVVGATVLDGWVFSGRHLAPDVAAAEISRFVTNGLA